uniref:Uncharacterized protein n=1 Tax=Arundo donax TaxID=35708 RepID=A0A0A9GI32_ARUDO
MVLKKLLSESLLCTLAHLYLLYATIADL